MDPGPTVPTSTTPNLSRMTKDEILHNPPWNKRTRMLYRKLKKKLNRLLGDAKLYKQMFKIRIKNGEGTL